MSSSKRWLLAGGIILLVVIIGAGVYFQLFFNKQQKAAENLEAENNAATSSGNNNPPVIASQWTPGAPPTIPDTAKLDASDITPSLTETAVDTLNAAKNYAAMSKAYNIKLSADQQAYLLKNHFILLPLANTNRTVENGWDEMLSAFDSIKGSDSQYLRVPENAKLVTPDVVLHAYHKFFENTLEELEKNELNSSLGDFLTDLYGNINAGRLNAPAGLKANYDRISAQLAVAHTLLENHGPVKPNYFENPTQENAFVTSDKTADALSNAKKILAQYVKDLPSDLQAKAQDELGLIYANKDVAVSPLFGPYKPSVHSDYTQYTPRSHYTKSSILRAYFRAMMYLGRSSYFLSSDDAIVDSNLITKAFGEKSSSGRVPVDSWKRIMGVTGFYAGQSDDLTYAEWQTYLQKNLGANNLDENTLSASSTLITLENNLTTLRLPKILSDIVVDPSIPSENKADLLRQSLSFRLFGQRFTYDASVLNDLTKGQEKSAYVLPSLPSALFVPAALGDARAGTDINTLLVAERKFSDVDVVSFDAALNKKQAELAAVKNDEWFSSLSSAWIYVLGSLTKKFNAGYPAYMQSIPFGDKQIQTFLGSYTELKHDTVLYAKQSYAELGGGPGEGKTQPVVKGFVEPNIVFWHKLQALITYNQQLFDYYNVFVNHSARERLNDFGNIVDFYTSLAEKELQNTPVSEEEYERLRTTGLAFMAEPFSAQDPGPDDWQTALVTDIHTDALTNSILYEGTGRPYLMLALVGNEDSPRVVAGVAYNHQEFAQPIGPRMTDEQWRQKVYVAPTTLPPQNFWYQPLTVK